eukprot:c17726_g1_i2 orf=362-1369(+)
MYNKCESVMDARQIFDKMPGRDIFSWNAMISGYSNHGQGEEAVKVFQQMQREGFNPNKVTFISILRACGSTGMVACGKLVHGLVLNTGLEQDVAVANALLSMYGKCGSVEIARKVFYMMPVRDVISWNAMIAVYAWHGQVKEATELLLKMQQGGVEPNRITFVSILRAFTVPETVPLGKLVHAHIIDRGIDRDVMVANALVSMYGKCGNNGSIEAARKVFDMMPKRNVVSWSTMIARYAQQGRDNKAFELLQQMQLEGVLPDKVTFISILIACCNRAALAFGKLIHAHIINNRTVPDLVVENALLTMYGRCGSVLDACRLFNKMTRQNVVSWTAM